MGKVSYTACSHDNATLIISVLRGTTVERTRGKFSVFLRVRGQEKSLCSIARLARICRQLLLAYKYVEGSREAISRGVLSVFMTTAR